MTPQVRMPATPSTGSSAGGRRGDHRPGGRSAAFGLKPLTRLGATCAAAGVLMIVGGMAGHTSGTTPHSQSVSPSGAAMAAAGEAVQVPLELAVQSMPAAGPPVNPGPPANPPTAQQPQKPQQPQRPPIQPGPPGGDRPGFYGQCREALTPGPPPNQRAQPGQYSPFDRDQDGKSCEN